MTVNNQSSRQPDWVRIEQENPGLHVTSTRFIGEGWNARAYLVNEELVFRFPKHAGHWDELDREISFLSFAADRLPLLTPRYLHRVPDSPASAHGYAAYRYIAGRALDPGVLTRKERDSAAERLAEFLKSLHGLRPDPAVAALLPREDEQHAARLFLAGAERDIVPRLERGAADTLVKVFETYLGAPGNLAPTPVVLHADLSSDHVLMAENAVTGVIDFGDVNWGDADYDFMYLFVDAGPGFVEEVARRYGHADIDRLRRKLRYFALVDQVDTSLDDEGRALPGQKTMAWERLHQILGSKPL
jgi:aminoglycoside 2''-phosphotransferase